MEKHDSEKKNSTDLSYNFLLYSPWLWLSVSLVCAHPKKVEILLISAYYVGYMFVYIHCERNLDTRCAFTYILYLTISSSKPYQTFVRGLER